MSTLWILFVVLAVANATGDPTSYEAAPMPLKREISGGGCAAGTAAALDRMEVGLADRLGINSLGINGLGVEDRVDLEGSHFDEVLSEHDAFLPLMATWRRRLASHAPALARLVKTFPGTEHLSEVRVRAALDSRDGLPAGVPTGDIFSPWINEWSGRWGDGSPQYHVWDPAYCREGRWVQRVAQSETAFPETARLEAMVRRNEADLAVNVFSDRFGITGWVSKRQHGPREIPCIGYLLEPATLLWICQTSGRPQQMLVRKELAQDGWFAYLESVEASAGSPMYHIYGHAFEITHREIRFGALSSLHTGHYRVR